MKTKILANNRFVILIVALIGLFIYSCDNSFLDENQMPDYTELQDTIFVTSYASSFQIDFTFNTDKACNWRLVQFPLWMTPSELEGKKDVSASASIQFTVYDENIMVDLGLYSFPLVFDIDGKQMVGYTVILANLGHPYINVSRTSVPFENTLTNSIEISNNSYGILSWWISSKPAWLKTDNSSGLIEQYQSSLLEMTVDLNGLEPGDYSGTMVIQSNAENQSNVSIQVTIHVGANASYGDYYVGQLIDARYNKNRDEVIVLTKSPNQLLFFSTDLLNPEIVDLDRVPQCLALSEDQATIAIGYSNSDITTYNSSNRSILKNYSAGAIPISIEFGGNDYLYFIASNSYWNYLHSLNLNTNEIIRQKNGESGMKTLQKVAGKPLLVSSRPGYSPDGLILFDISQAGQVDSINTYHMDLEGYWISEDGERLFSGWKKIYDLPDFAEGQSFFPYELNVTGQLNFSEQQVVDCISDQSSTSRIFVANGFQGEEGSLLLRVYNSSTLVEQNSYELKYARPSFFSVYSTWSGHPFALFPSSDKENLWIVQKHALYTYDAGIWSVSKADITK